MWVAMLGEGMNWNMRWDRDASYKAINEFPVPVVLTVDGQAVKTGRRTQTLADSNPIKTVYKLWEKHYNEIDRSSWDQISTLFAVEGESDYFTLERGALQFTMEGGAIWEAGEKGEDYRLYNKISNDDIADVIENLMIQAPE